MNAAVEYLKVILDGNVVEERRDAFGRLCLVSRLPDSKTPHEIALRHRFFFASQGCSIFAGPCRPARTMTIAEMEALNARIAKGEPATILQDQTPFWRELWMVPNLAMPEAVQMLESLEFPGCIRDDIALGAKEVRETVALELIAIQSQHPIHLVALDKWCVEFAFAEEMIPEAARKAITQRVFKLNASMFPASAWRNSIRKRWLENGVFEFGPV